MKKAIMSLILAALVICAMALNVSAQAPNSIMYQGRLTNAAGDPITTNTSVTFYIYAAPTGGAPLYTAVHAITPDANGVFTVELLSVNTTVLNGTKRYLAMKVGADPEMTPRQLLTSAGYAYSAENVANMPGLAFNANEASSNNFVNIPAATAAVDSISITVPGAGYVYVWALASISINHTNTIRDEFYFMVSNLRALMDYSDFGFAAYGVPSGATTGQYMAPINAHRVFTVNAAGTYKYYANTYQVYGNDAGDDYIDLQLTAFYFPKAYGTIEQPTKINPQVSDDVPAGANEDSDLR